MLHPDLYSRVVFIRKKGAQNLGTLKKNWEIGDYWIEKADPGGRAGLRRGSASSRLQG